MRSAKAAITIAALAASLATPTLAVGAPYIPPGNSAASQYTETIPSAGGAVVAEGIEGGKSKASPEKSLGHHTAKVLEKNGAEGEAVAALASGGAAPATSEPEAGESSGGQKPESSKPHESGSKGSHGGGAAGAAGGGSGGGKGSGTGAGGSGKAAATEAGSSTAGSGSGAGGSSALGQVVSHATLSSSGSAGIFLPLALVAALVWAAVFVVRRRRGEATHA